MSRYALHLTCCLILTNAAGCGASSPESSASAQDALPVSKGVAVIELFTSQGCSSCPPADQVLTRIVAWRDRHRRPVYCLSFHVDYWNRLGWTDPYSARTYSLRQRGYAAGMKKRRVYTPQMIVNGTTEFVGSRSDDATTALREALATPTTHTIRIAARYLASDGVAEVRYEVSGSIEDRVLNLAVVESSRENEVPRGENANRSLLHTNIVRAFKVLALEQGSGTTSIPLADLLSTDSLPERAKLIAYVQNRKSLLITGAAEASFTQE